MASVNKVIVLGNVGKDVELKYSASGVAICNVSLATSRRSKSKATGEVAEETEWHTIVCYDRLAEIAGEYLKKGRPAYFEGRLRTRKWQDKEGNARYTTEIVAESLQLLGGRDDAAGSGGAGAGAAGGAAASSRPAQRPAARPAAPKPAPTETSFDDMDDDIPF